ncbi:LLM class flavin-dependent oxidoreductase [Actinoalloteichus sp. AHMU CJ021]|uniref:LLM class flavin-dependent oxidoreductase n=1 Tax=Actinoalloteichus TaxID=65496 RepID=UPI0003F554D8|nr:LLM class flavin-dependent oxidoreductase [Actinoalloteichus caeruleus]AUS78681.1 LLM class flavin-dependent oxidoreductase [Actinoalloteichus sp. AHMU CJ021]
MRVGIVILPEHRWWAAEPKWRAAEEYGFDHAWTYDHLGWRSLVDGPWFSAVPTLTAAALVTSRIRLGTYVASPNFRHPIPFARDVAALDDVSDGRLLVGIGAGGAGYDVEVLGGRELPPRARVDRYGEFVELLDTVLTNDRTTWRGDYYEAVDARSAPGCVQRPRAPFVLAANGRRSMRLVARHGDGWVTTGRQTEDEREWWSSVVELSSVMDEVLASENRGSASVDRYLSLDSGGEYGLTSVEYFRDALGRARELGFTDVVVHWPRSDGPYAGHESVLEAVAAEVLPALRP